MVKLHGAFGRAMLELLTRRFGALAYDDAIHDPHETSRLRQYFGASLETRLRDRTVVDFGCGRGADAVIAALAGAKRVIGIDIDDAYLDSARTLARDHGVAQTCTFVNAQSEAATYRALRGTCDVVFSIDAFEHFGDPAAVLAEMNALLCPGGTLLISFGPPWKHPYGAHMNHFNTLPWVHFVFSEDAILAVRRQHVDDGVTRFEDLPGGLNRMTVARFEDLVARSGLRFDEFEALPIRGLKLFTANRVTREYFTSMVKAVLHKAA